MEKLMRRLLIIGCLIIIAAVTIPVLESVSRGGITRFLPPRPVVVSSDTGIKSNFSRFTFIVWATVRNDGGNGDVVVEITYSENNRSWTKTTRRNFSANETSRMKMEFPEATLLGKNRHYRVSVR